MKTTATLRKAFKIYITKQDLKVWAKCPVLLKIALKETI